MPLRGDRLRMTTSPRVTLGSWKKSWLVVRCSWLVKAYYHSRISYGQISLAGSPRASPYRHTIGCDRVSQRDALRASPTHTVAGRFFCDLQPATCELRYSICNWSYYQLPSIIKVKPQNFHFLRSQNHQIAKFAFFEVTAMKYESLYSLYYKDNQIWEKVYQERFHSPFSRHLPLAIKQYHRRQSHPAFFCYTEEIALSL